MSDVCVYVWVGCVCVCVCVAGGLNEYLILFLAKSHPWKGSLLSRTRRCYWSQAEQQYRASMSLQQQQQQQRPSHNTGPNQVMCGLIAEWKPGICSSGTAAETEVQIYNSPTQSEREWGEFKKKACSFAWCSGAHFRDCPAGQCSYIDP